MSFLAAIHGHERIDALAIETVRGGDELDAITIWIVIGGGCERMVLRHLAQHQIGELSIAHSNLSSKRLAKSRKKGTGLGSWMPNLA